VTERVASAGIAHAGATPSGEIAKLCWGVRAVIDDDWLIFLDVARNRYRAIKRSAAPGIAGIGQPVLRSADNMPTWRALARDGLVSSPPYREAAERPVERTTAKVGDVFSVALAALWARRIVRHGTLLDAFGALSSAKARLSSDSSNSCRALSAYARFAAARIWIPGRYVCLFDSLCLMRVLLAQGVSADLVFGVRGRPFAAHCWVECEGEILDDGGEACSSFVEIVRI